MNTVLTTGRRKKSSAKVFLKKGTGVITINNRTLADYFPIPFDQQCVRSPFEVIAQQNKYDVKVCVRGGGTTGQKEAIRLGISRALIKDPELRGPLKAAGFTTRINRRKERKVPGQTGARGGHTFSKR